MTPAQIRFHITKTILARLDTDAERRKEALTEFMAVTMTAQTDGTADHLAELIPPIMNDLYAKWVSMFIDKVLETSQHDAVALLCDGTPDNDAALLLAYIMFLESERMEKQVEEDLRAYGAEQSGEVMGDLAADYIRARMAAIAEQVNPKKQ